MTDPILNVRHWLVVQSATRHRFGATQTFCLVLDDNAYEHRLKEGLGGVIEGIAAHCTGVEASLWTREQGWEIRILHNKIQKKTT